jgi:hypothetical protein
MRQFVCLRIAPAGEMNGSAFIFRVNGLKVVGQKNGHQIGAYPIISKKINIPGSHIIMLYDVFSNAQDKYFLTARFTRFRAFSIALF